MPRLSVVLLSASPRDAADPTNTSASTSSNQLPRSVIIGGATGGAVTLIGMILVIVLCIQQSRVQRKHQGEDLLLVDIEFRHSALCLL